MPKVWIADKMSSRAVEVFKARGIDVDYKPGCRMKRNLLSPVITMPLLCVHQQP